MYCWMVENAHGSGSRMNLRGGSIHVSLARRTGLNWTASSAINDVDNEHWPSFESSHKHERISHFPPPNRLRFETSIGRTALPAEDEERKWERFSRRVCCSFDGEEVVQHRYEDWPAMLGKKKPACSIAARAMQQKKLFQSRSIILMMVLSCVRVGGWRNFYITLLVPQQAFGLILPPCSRQ